MKNIKFTCSWWSDSKKLTRRVLDQFFTESSDLFDYRIVHDDSYDIIVFFGYVSEPIKPTANAYLFPQEPTWTGTHQKHFNGMPNLTVYGFDRTNYGGDCKFVETFAHMFYGGIGPDGEGWDDWKYNNIKNIAPKKTMNMCSTISSRGDDWTSFSGGCMYQHRCGLVRNIHHLDFIDFFGGWQLNGANIKSYALRKFDALLPYKFTLTVENSNENYYVSEKFFDPILTNSIPIYFGCKNIKTLFPENGYILLDNLTDHTKIVSQLNYINDNADRLYGEMLPEALKIKRRYFNELNPLNKILAHDSPSNTSTQKL